MKWDNFEHQIWNDLKKIQLKDRPLILTISGGMDSMVLLHLFHRLNLKNRLVITHFHHGKSHSSITTKFRNESLKAVKDYCGKFKKENWVFESEIYKGKVLNSEAEFRSARKKFIDRVRSRYPDSVVVTGHHRDDLLETQVLKLLRGNGSASVSRFQKWNGEILRPFLQFSKLELKNFAVKHNLFWVEDPSNDTEKYLRNWLRNNWLPALDQRQAGLSASFARGLSQLVSKQTPELDFSICFDMILNMEISSATIRFTIDRMKFKKTAQNTRRNLIYVVYQRALAAHRNVFSQNDRSRKKDPQFWEITTGRIEEILKRLDKNQKGLTFNIGPLKALTSEETIVLEFGL